MTIASFALAHEGGNRPQAPSFCDAVTFTGDNAYPTGGTPGFKALVNAVSGDNRTPIGVITNKVSGNVGYNLRYDLANDKLQVFNGSAEVAAATDLSGVTFQLLVLSF